MHVGIDLGTTFSAVSYYDRTQNKPLIIENRYGHSVTPSVLRFNENEVLFGEDAKECQSLGDDNCIAFFKREMGKPNFSIAFGDSTYNAEELSGIFLKCIVRDAENKIGKKITSAVITVPAYFNNHQRMATMQAGEKAGLKVLRIINEPTAAAIAYGLTGSEDEKKIMVYDLGGGTFDVTIARINKDQIEVLGTDGDHNLGGKNWDDMVANYVAGLFYDEFNIDVFNESDEFYELLIKSEKAKKDLTSKETANIKITCKGEKANYEITLDKFNELTRDLMERTKMLSDNLLKELGINWIDLDGVLLVGGSTRMKAVSAFVHEMSGKEPVRGINVDEAVALGAAIQAEMDVNTGENNQGRYTLGGKNISDATSHSLGMVSINEDRSKFINCILIPKNEKIPNSKSKPFKIISKHCIKGETTVYILQGENIDPLDCTVLGKYVISGIDTNTTDEIVLDIKYDYDINGVVKVSSTQRNTGKSLDVSVEAVPEDMSWLGMPPDSVNVAEPITIMIAVDLSGSMSGHPLEAAKKAAKKLVDDLDLSYANVGLIACADRSQVIFSPNNKIKTIYKGIDSMSIGSVGYGNSDHPFDTALKEMRKGNNKDFLIVLTDGVWGNPGLAVARAEECKRNDIEIIAIGFGSANKTFLKQIASTDESALLTDLNSLSQSFSNIAQSITEGTSRSLRGF